MEKVCEKHGNVHHLKRNEGSFRCGKCASMWVVKSRVKKKKRLVELFGGKCKLCGYKRYIGSLDFHHKNPREKSFSLSVKGLCYAWDDILKEASKCVLLCKNCHMEVESGIRKL